MTALRDTFLVEQSLLRTLCPLLGITKSCLYRVDNKGAIMRILHHARAPGHDHAPHSLDHVEEFPQEQDIPALTRELLDSIRVLGQHCVRALDGNFLIGFPLYGNGELRGYFVFQRDHKTSASENAIVRGILDVFTNYYDLLDNSQRDQLTGLLNRYSLETNLDRIWSLLAQRLQDNSGKDSRRTALPHTYWLGVLDIDFFKKINDTHGHIIGDEVLIMTARLLEQSFRQSDLLYRFGGEEFIAIIAANDLESATRSFERARKTVEEFLFPQIGHVTISGGFCGADTLVPPQEVIHRADSALYAAKAAGRNRIYHYDTLVHTGVLKEVQSGAIDLF